MTLIVGLGNPGEEYQKTRHNVGFLVLDRFAKGGSHSTKIDSFPKILFLRPNTYMNLSGKAVKDAMKNTTMTLNDLWVIQDEADLPLGTIRVKKGGTDAGHNGIKSIDSEIGSEYWRVRIGVGRQDGKDLADHVLEHFSNVEYKFLERIIDQTADLLVKFLKSGIKPITITI